MKKGLTANSLKLLAIVAMLLDHVAAVFLEANTAWYIVMRAFGRITAPIMCFFIAEGYNHTRNLKRYMLRLLVFAVLSHFPYVLCNNLLDTVTTSIMLPLLMGLVALWLYDADYIPKSLTYLGILGCFCVAYPCDWSCIPVLLVLLFGMFRNRKKELLLRYGFVCAVICAATLVNSISDWYFVGIFLTIPLIYMYNGEPGKKSAFIKWSFYVFYPLHMLVLALLRQVV